MKHLLISREFPPCTYPVGGIGTYVQHIARLLAEHGETVHVIAERWDQAPLAREERQNGRLIVHRVPMSRPLAADGTDAHDTDEAVLDSLGATPFPAQAFSWQAARLAEELVESEGIDIIEAQDYEAPLYYFLLRRAAGLGPPTHPPCFVHLHTTRELVCMANDWGLRSSHDLLVKRLEDHAICAADALLSPSAFLAAHAEWQYGLQRGAIHRIPYPIGDVPLIQRSPQTWAGGTICYFGRFEVRKGVIEWMSAAIEAARRHPALRFELIGADTRLFGESGASVRETLESRVPADLASSFVFRDALGRADLWNRLAEARLAVVPSRFENFPNTCIEAMCSGLPVLVSPHGGMAEMVDDGRTGWIARSGQPDDLAETLSRALATPPDTLAAMGRAASEAIRVQCDNRHTVVRQLEFRRALIARGAGRSLRVPVVPAWLPPPHTTTDSTRHVSRVRAYEPPLATGAAGIAAIVLDVAGADLDQCLESLEQQTCPPVAVVVVGPASGRALTPDRQQRSGWSWLRDAGTTEPAARAAALDLLLSGTNRPMGVVSIDADVLLDPSYLETTHRLLTEDSSLGLVSAWSTDDTRPGGLTSPLSSSLPYAWIEDRSEAATTMRTAGIEGAAWVREVVGGDAPAEDLAVAILAEGWKALTIPSVLSQRVRPVAPDRADLQKAARRRLRLAVLARYPALAAEAGPLLLHLMQANDGCRAAAFDAAGGAVRSAAGAVALARRALKNPRYATDWLLWQSRRQWRRLRT